jgi:hypothetical protein
MRYALLSLSAALGLAAAVMAVTDVPHWGWFLGVSVFLGLIAADMDKDDN